MKQIAQGIVSLITISTLFSCSMHDEQTAMSETNSVPVSTQTLFVSTQDGDREIYVAQIDGSQQKQLTNNKSDDYEASWSPDGTKIAFTSNRIKGNTEVYIMDADGSNQQNISNSPGFDGRASWSPDGQYLAFNSARNGVEQIYLWERASGKISQLTNTEHTSVGPVWSPNGQWIAFQNYGKNHKPDIWITSKEGEMTRQLTSYKKSEDGAISWSPDNKKIAFQSRRNYQYNLYIYDLEKEQELQLTKTKTSDVQPRWSASGDKIVFMSNRGPHGRNQICLMQEDGTEQRCITDSRYQAADPVWLTDSRILHSNWNGKRFANIYVLDLTTEQLTPVAPASGYQSNAQPRPAVLPGQIARLSSQQVAEQ